MSVEQLVDRVTVERPARPRRGVRRMWSLDRLPMPRVFMTGPRWRSAFGVREIPIADLDAAAAKLHRPGRKLLIFSLEEDVRERVMPPEIRPGVYAEW